MPDTAKRKMILIDFTAEDFAKLKRAAERQTIVQGGRCSMRSIIRLGTLKQAAEYLKDAA